MIQTFLDVERLAEGQMDLKREAFEAQEVVETCLGRVRPLAERKQIQIRPEGPVEGTLVGDRELMEYAVYNLLTNAVKYSPADTTVTVRGERQAKPAPGGSRSGNRHGRQGNQEYFPEILPDQAGRGLRRSRHRHRAVDRGADCFASRRPDGGDQHARQRLVLYHGIAGSRKGPVHQLAGG